MYRTIEAIYRDGRIYPLNDELDIKIAKVLLTILDESDKDIQEDSDGMKLKYEDITKFANSISLKEDPLKYQKRMRNEW